MEYRHAVLKIQYIVSKSRYHVLRFYKNNNRKHSISNACGCFEMVEATGVEPVSEIYVELTFYMVICNTDTADLGAAALSVRAQAVCNSQGACLCVYAL